MFDNLWELYSSVPGAEAFAAKLDAAVVTALATAETAVSNGSTLMQAALCAISEVGKLMNGKEASDFGACDPEPYHHLEWRVKKHFKTRYGVTLENL